MEKVHPVFICRLCPIRVVCSYSTITSATHLLDYTVGSNGDLSIVIVSYRVSGVTNTESRGDVKWASRIAGEVGGGYYIVKGKFSLLTAS